MQKNEGQTSGAAGLDLNVESVWMQGITGRGVVVAVVDDGKIWGTIRVVVTRAMPR